MDSWWSQVQMQFRSRGSRLTAEARKLKGYKSTKLVRILIQKYVNIEIQISTTRTGRPNSNSL